jgi:hypothetical protein
MQPKTSDIPRRWNRKPAKILICLVSKAEVKTVLALLPGECVGIVANR